MAVFGVPVTHEDDAARALRSAERMNRRLGQLNESLATSHGVTLEIRIGVNTGQVMASTEPLPGEGMIAGDSVTVAARLQQTAKPGQILVSERTARATRGFRFAEIPPVSLKGKSAPMRALSLLEETARAELGIPGMRAPLIGRDAEIALLDTMYDRVVQEQRPYLVTVFGDPGVGKSRLFGEFVQRLEYRADAPVFLSGRCLPYGDGVTYWPLAEILKGLAGILDSDASDLVVEKIRKLGHHLLTSTATPHPAEAAAALAYTVGVEDAAFDLRNLPPRQVRVEIHGAWRSLFSVLAADRPVAILIEDIHWADAAMLDLLEELAEHASIALLILCSARPELTNRRPTWGGGRRNYSAMFLDPLSQAESDRLLGSFVATQDLPTKLGRRILERAEGNPFFIEEILRHLIDDGVLVRDGGSFRATSDATDVVLPDTVQAVIGARIDMLSLQEKRVLQAAAVVGRQFWSGVVRQLLGDQDADIESILDRLEARELIRAQIVSSIGNDRQYIFKHALTREVCYESLPRKERAGRHASTAAWLESTAAGRHTEFAELLAHHYLEAFHLLEQDVRADARHTEEMRRRAFEYLLTGAQETMTKLVLEKSQQLAEHALQIARDSLERSRALTALGLTFKNGFVGDRAWPTLREAVEERLAATPQDHRTIVELCTLALDIPLRWPGSMRALPPEREAGRYLELAMKHAESFPADDSQEMVRLLSAKTFYPFAYPEQVDSDEELEVARKDGQRAADMARRLGRADLESAALDGAHSALISRDLWGHVDPIINRRLELVSAMRDPWEVGDTHAMAAWSCFMQGRFLEALRLAHQGLDRIGTERPAPRLHCLTWSAMARFRLGHWAAFLKDLSSLQNLLGDRTIKPPPYAVRSFAAAALVHEIQGNRSASDAFLAMIAETERREQFGAFTPVPWVALVLARRGNTDDALKRLQRVGNTGAGRQARGLMLEARCEIIADAELWGQARAAAQDARLHGYEAKLLALPLIADRIEGLVALREERYDEAVTLLGHASAGYDGLEARWDEARCDLALAEALIATGHGDEARVRLQRAAATFERLNAVREGARASELLTRLS